MHDALAASRSTLTSLSGLGTVLAAKILGHIGDVSRFPTRHHFASYTGSAPLDASSGKNVRHRLNTGGNRPLNSALLSRSGSSPRGRSLLVPRAPGRVRSRSLGRFAGAYGSPPVKCGVLPGACQRFRLTDPVWGPLGRDALRGHPVAGAVQFGAGSAIGRRERPACPWTGVGSDLLSAAGRRCRCPAARSPGAMPLPGAPCCSTSLTCRFNDWLRLRSP